MAHLLSCRLLDEACTADELATVTERAMACARKWGGNGVKDTKEEEDSTTLTLSPDTFPVLTLPTLPLLVA